MSLVVLDHIPFQPDTAVLQQELCIRQDSRQVDQLARLIREAQAIARPKALYRVTQVTSQGDDYVIIDGVRFDSRVLRVNLDGALRIFPHIVTCGMELEEWSNALDDVIQRYWAEAINRMALRAASHALDAHLAQHHHPGLTSCISPGVFPDWPLRQQRALFELLGDPQGTIGVRLLKSAMMMPFKSTSGIIYPSAECFVICELCATEYCPGRSAPYDQTLYDRKYRSHSV
jgi:hypothetical protein